MEVWKELKELGCLVSDAGNIKSLCSDNLKQYRNTGGYKHVFVMVMRRVIDHINDVKTDNRACNLQVVSQWANMAKRCKDFGGCGVSWEKASKKWIARASINGVITDLGLFTHEPSARYAYETAKRENYWPS